MTTQTDVANCGGCGQACASGDFCAAGACVPLTSLWLATGVTVTKLAVDDSGVYWTDGSANVQSVGLTGGTVVTLASSQAQPSGIALDDTYVYWSNTLGGAIMRAPKDGSGSPAVVATATSPRDIGIYGDNVYWIDSSANVWQSAKAGGGTPAIAATPDHMNEILVANARGVFVFAIGANVGIYCITAGWSVMASGLSNALVDDGQHLFSDLSGQPSAVLASIDESTGKISGYYTGVNGDSLYPIAANACGVFLSHGGLMLPSAQFPVSLVTSLTPQSLTLQSGATLGGYFYFYANQSIGRLPQP